jgi:hypothetical protein
MTGLGAFSPWNSSYAIIALRLLMLLNYSRRKYSSIGGPWIGPTLLVACCVKAISIHVISVK